MLLNLLRNNFGLKVLAVFLALAAWGYFHLAAAPGTTARFDQTLLVPIVVSGLKPGYQAHLDTKVATIVVEAPRNGDGLRPDQVQAVVAVDDVAAGAPHNVKLNIVSPDIALKSISPASVSVTLDHLDERTLRISYDYVGDRRGIVVDSAQIDPQKTTLRGPSIELAKVTAVRVDIVIPAKPEQVDQMIRATPTGATGEEITAVQVSPNLVRVRAKFIAASASATSPK